MGGENTKTDKSAKNKLAGFAEQSQNLWYNSMRNRDAFGTPYLANLENDVGFGYTGKIFDSATGLYDYGFRDYAPNSARFTTVDPVRDGSNWFSYVVNDPVNYIDLWGLESTDKSYTLDAFEYQLKTNQGVLQQVVEELSQKSEDIISFSQLLDNHGNSSTERFADALTSKDGFAVLQDTTRSYIEGMSKVELIDSLNAAKLVTGMDFSNVTKAIEKLNLMNFDIKFDPVESGADAFSISGFVFMHYSTNNIVSKKMIENKTYYMIDDVENMRLIYHEDVHYQAALATGNTYQWFANYNNENQKKIADGMTEEQAYFSLSDEREAYSFGPMNQSAETNIQNTVTENYDYIRW